MLWLLLVTGSVTAQADTIPLSELTLARIVSADKNQTGELRCGYTRWGQFCTNGKRDWSSTTGQHYHYSGRYIRHEITEAKFARFVVRCNAEAKLLYINDDLDTRQELFDKCMVGELARAD